MLPIKIHLSPAGPNPWKPVLICEELNIPYEINSIAMDKTKEKPFIDLNPNGRVPAMEDPNTHLTLWESGPITQYLIEQYDTSHTLSYTTLKERHLCNQWLAFQISGQGPYFGQATWFLYLHPERVPSAVSRYVAELKRVLGVLETALEGRDWLIGDKMTYADLAFAPWNERVDAILQCGAEEKFKGFPNVEDWHRRMTERGAWKRAMEIRARELDVLGYLPNGMPKELAEKGAGH